MGRDAGAPFKMMKANVSRMIEVSDLKRKIFNHNLLASGCGLVCSLPAAIRTNSLI